MHKIQWPQHKQRRSTQRRELTLVAFENIHVYMAIFLTACRNKAWVEKLMILCVLSMAAGLICRHPKAHSTHHSSLYKNSDSCIHIHLQSCVHAIFRHIPQHKTRIPYLLQASPIPQCFQMIGIHIDSILPQLPKCIPICLSCQDFLR